MKSGEHDPAYYQAMWKTLGEGGTWKGRLVNRKKDGTLFTEDAVISPVRNATGTITNFVAVKHDITANIALEAQYRQAQKMEAVGQLTGGVAHDFNNLLQVINANTDLVLQDLEPGHPVRGMLGEIRHAGDRAARLVSQLLAFSRRQILRPEHLDLNEVVANMLTMLRRLIDEHVQLQWHPGRGVCRIRADRGMIEQVLMNLCVNARDAMPEGGTLTIESRDVSLHDDGPSATPLAISGRYAFLRVADTGCGMNKEMLDRVFEPFFTTKEVGKGSGLGLATVYGIVKQHHGMISVDSEPGRGTSFNLHWPVSEMGEHEAAAGTEVADAVGGTETILLAEDDATVRKATRRMLERAGYQVIAAADGEEAIDLFASHPEEIDLALLDVVMPTVGGREAYDRIRAQSPDLKAIFASGYSDAGIHTDFVLEEGLRLIRKPFTQQTLLRAVREALDAPAPSDSGLALSHP